jgi:hypothetical protein
VGQPNMHPDVGPFWVLVCDLATTTWLCDYIRDPADRRGPGDLALLGNCVSAVGCTIAADGAMARARTAPARLLHHKEVYYTQESSTQSDVVMSSAHSS